MPVIPQPAHNTILAREPAARLASTILHVMVAEPQSALRLPVALPHAMRVALTARIAAAGGRLLPQDQGLSALFIDARAAIRMVIAFMDSAAALPIARGQPLAVRAVLVTSEKNFSPSSTEQTQAAASERAQRIIAVSRDHSLLICRSLYEHLDPSLLERARLAIAPAIADEHPGYGDIFELDWHGASELAPSVTGIPQGGIPTDADGWIELTHGGTQIRLAPRDCPLLLGRDRSCQLHLEGDVASRIHGRIEYVHEKFYFVDESRNGTYLLTPQGEEIYLHQERLPLLGRGVISPGAPIVKQTGEVVRYTCRSQPEAAAA